MKDNTDPQALGMKLMQMRETRGDCQTLAQAHDVLMLLGAGIAGVPNYDPQPIEHWHRYRKELEERAADGDKYAASLLRGESLAEDPVD